MNTKDINSKEYALWFSGYLKDALENLKLIKDTPDNHECILAFKITLLSNLVKAQDILLS